VSRRPRVPPVLLLRFFPILLRVSSHLVSPSTIQHHSSGLRGVITHTYLPLRAPPSLSRVFAFPQDREPASGIRITPELKGVDLPPALYYRVRDMNVKPGTERRALLFDLCKVGYGQALPIQTQLLPRHCYLLPASADMVSYAMRSPFRAHRWNSCGFGVLEFLLFPISGNWTILISAFLFSFDSRTLYSSYALPCVPFLS